MLFKFKEIIQKNMYLIEIYKITKYFNKYKIY